MRRTTIMQRTMIPAVCLMAFAPPATAREPPARLFADENTLDVTIEAPLGTLLRTRDDEEYLDGSFTWTDASGRRQALDLKLRARGRYRRQRKVCYFPPVRLNFRKKQVAGTLFDGQDKLKLVTHCQPRSERFDQYVLKEYLAYRWLQALTDYSFEVRLLRIDWIDTDGEHHGQERYGFLIEDDELLGERIGMPHSEISGIRPGDLHQEQAALVAVFQYLIGNTDFSMTRGARDAACCHNVELYETGDGRFLPVPYDFDFAGLVDAPYAEPNPRLRIRGVTTRLYRGYCTSNGHVRATLDRVFAQAGEIRRRLRDLPGLTERTQRRAARFLERFYSRLDDPARGSERLVRDCL